MRVPSCIPYTYHSSKCSNPAQELNAQIGYGNAAGFLFNRNLLSAPPPNTTEDPSSRPSGGKGKINPITGTYEQPARPMPEMTQEEKEREAEKLFTLFDRLEKAGGMENPIKTALHAGKLEKYATEV